MKHNNNDELLIKVFAITGQAPNIIMNDINYFYEVLHLTLDNNSLSKEIRYTLFHSSKVSAENIIDTVLYLDKRNWKYIIKKSILKYKLKVLHKKVSKLLRRFT